jgi:hypothetical protein
MKLNVNSVSARLYRWFYVTNKMPQNLCPYFWKLVIMWILIVPYTILSLPYIVVYKGKDNSDSFGEKPVTGFFIYCILGLVLSMLFSISIFFVGFYPKDTFLLNFQTLGSLLWMIAILFGGYCLIIWLVEKYKDSKIKYDENGVRIFRPKNEKDPNILIEWIKASYNKYCPRIEWTSFKHKN